MSSGDYCRFCGSPTLEKVLEEKTKLEAQVSAIDPGNAYIENGVLKKENSELQAQVAWVPMDTAPKGSGPDGPELVTDIDYICTPNILMIFENGEVSVGFWDWYHAEGGRGYEGGLAWIEPVSGERLDLIYDAPTGWRPLPPPTKESS